MKNDPSPTKELDQQVAALTTQLDTSRTDKGTDEPSYAYATYEKVGGPKRKELSDGVNALAECSSKLAAAVAK